MSQERPDVRPFTGFAGSDALALIRPPEDPDAGALTGPPGFAATAHRLSPGHSLHRTAPLHHLVVLVIEGTVAVAAEGDAQLGPRDTQLVSPGTPVAIRAIGDEAMVLVLAYRERDRAGAWARQGRARSGIARPERIAPLRRRFPLRLARGLLRVLSPEDLFPLVGPTARGPGRFAVPGPQGLMVVAATTPPGTGPALHIHSQTIEMFIVLQGRYRVFWGDAGEHDVHLGRLGAAVFPVGISRAFEATGDGDDWILPMVVGADDEREDIIWLPAVLEQMRRGPRALFRVLSLAGVVRVEERAA